MIPDQWYAILEASEVKTGRLLGVTRLGEKMVFWRDAQGRVACVSDRCPHRGVALSAGQVVGDCVECPFHGFQYDATGACRVLPANGLTAPIPKAMRVRAYPVREAHGFIWLWWGEPRDDLPPVSFFEDLDDGFSYATYRDHWATHYSRAIENQLDVVHLPFVHKTTIGRGGKTVVDGPVAKLIGDELRVWVSNRPEDGVPARKPGQMPEPERLALLCFRFPNVWQNRISDDLRVLVAFAPIDNENTLMYLRFYQRFMRTPLLRSVVNRLGAIMNHFIAEQDRRVVITQRPARSDLRIGETLIPGDRPIVLYRERRRELIEQAAQVEGRGNRPDRGRG